MPRVGGSSAARVSLLLVLASSAAIGIQQQPVHGGEFFERHFVEGTTQQPLSDPTAAPRAAPPRTDAARQHLVDNLLWMPSFFRQWLSLNIVRPVTAAAAGAAGRPLARSLRAASAASDVTATHEQHAPQPKRTCHPDCSKRGNCNAAEGRCECPFGLQGEACEQLAFPACRPLNITLQQAEAFKVDLLTTCAESMHANCECYKQCWRHYCPDQKDCRLFRDPQQKCYTYHDLPPEQQVSVHPQPTWTNVTYFSEISGLLGNVSRQEFEVHDEWGTRASPPDRCPHRCSNRGLCTSAEVQIKGRNKTLNRCLCMQGFTGDGCEEQTSHVCLNNCSKRGKCIRGFCLCKPPYYGTACLKSAARTGQQRKRQKQPAAHSRLKIYMYDLPWQLAFQDGLYPEWYWHDSIYTAFWKFTSMLAEDQHVLTDSPEEADLFFVPALNYYYSSNVGDPSLHMLDVIEYIRHQHPHWNASGGSDHFYFVLNDRGTCNMQASIAELWAPIKLVHFGAFSPNLSQDMGLPSDFGRADYGCFQPNKDIVVAPYHDEIAKTAYTTYMTKEGTKTFEGKREVLLAFAGGIRYDEPEYSGGVRQRLHEKLRSNRTSLERPEDSASWPAQPDEVIIHDGFSPWHDDWLRAAKFCLAPYGHGWGIRLSMAVATGCVPVIIQDHVFQPYEDLLPYGEFSVRLPAADVPRIREVLAAVEPQEWRRLHEGLKRWWRPFVWELDLQGTAYQTTISNLRKRHASGLAGLASAARR